MAHKTFSQEQYQFQSYGMLLSFGSGKNTAISALSSINESITLGLALRNAHLYNNLGTNLFLLTRVGFAYNTSDKTFFKIKNTKEL